VATPLVKEILLVLNKGLSAYEKYLATRQEAYERKMDRNNRRALTHAGAAFRRLHDLELDIDDKKFNNAKRKYYKYRGRV